MTCLPSTEEIGQMSPAECGGLIAKLRAAMQSAAYLGGPLPSAWHTAFRALEKRVNELRNEAEQERAIKLAGQKLTDSKGAQ